MGFKCLRCGYCCIASEMTILNPKYQHSEINTEKPFSYISKIMTKSAADPCPYLIWNEETNTSTCSVYDKEWFPSTLCKHFNTISDQSIWFPIDLQLQNQECIVGKFIKLNFPPLWWKDWWNWLPPNL